MTVPSRASGRVAGNRRLPPEPMAVVGMGIRAPGGITDAASYWAAIMRAGDLTSELPDDRRRVFAREWEGLITRGGYLESPFDFDARFFGMSPREARTVDPQHRLLLEVVWESFEDSGLLPDAVAEHAGLFVGITGQDYRHWLPGEPNSYTTVGNGHSFSAGRVAHELGLRGPVFALDTACSSSLVAVHTACRALAAGDCDVAVAAGVNLILSPRTTREVARTGALSPDGRSRPFDAAANGFVRAEACGAVILKRLADSLRDRDRIHAVIDGSAINQDGRSATFTAPNAQSQVSLISGLLADTGLTGDDIGYHEAHGTGTPLGDPIEMRAIATAMRGEGRGRPLHVGSVKANLGHAESAAGIIALIKVVLCLERRTIPPQAMFDTLSPQIDLTGTGIVIPTAPRRWGAEVGQRASACSYGMSGTNAYVVLSAAPPADRVRGGAPGYLISARGPAAASELAARYRDYLAGSDPEDYPAFAYTATHGRTRLQHAMWIDAASHAQGLAAAAAVASGREHPAVRLLGQSAPLPWQPSDEERSVISLPAYAWQHSSYVIPIEERNDGSAPSSRH